MKRIKHPVVKDGPGRPKGAVDRRPDSDDCLPKHSLIAIEEGVGVCVLIGPDGYDLNHKPFVGERRYVTLQFRNESGWAEGVSDLGVKRLGASVSSQPNKRVRRNRAVS